jgi:polysaccharide biosynthesis protein PslH
MNILQLINKVPYPAIDGGSIATLNMTEAFIKSGINVTILAMNTSKHFVTPQEIEKYKKDNLTIICIDVNTDLNIFKAIYNYFFSELPYNAQRFFSKSYLNILIELMNNHSYDIIQLEGLYLSMYIPFIRQFSDALVSVRAHNVEHEIWQRIAQNEKSVFKKKYLNVISRRVKILENKMLSLSDVLIPITERDADSFRNMGCKIPIHVSQSGINIQDCSKLTDNHEFPSLFFIGALDWIPNQQGLEWFFENVWDKILRRLNNVKLYIAGRNAPQWFVKYIEEKKAIYYGEVENAHEFILNKSIMIVPLLSGGGMRIKIIEGMALGKTIVTTSIGTEGINSTHDENILIADSPGEFAIQIEKVYLDKSLCNAIGQNANRFVIDNYNNTTICSFLINFYNSELNNKNKHKSYV